MNLIQQDLVSCSERLASRESELAAKISDLTRDAAIKKASNDLNGARYESLKTTPNNGAEKLMIFFRSSRKKLVERKRVQAQMEKIVSSISVIDNHINAIEGTELNRSILETLRASGDALKRLGVQGGIEEVEKVVTEVEHQMENAAEVTR